MFNLAALGAGLGEFAQQYRQQQEQALRQQQLQMQMQQFAQRQQEQQRQTAAQAGLAALARSGGLDQQFQGLSPMPQAGVGGGSPDMGGGMRAGGALTRKGGGGYNFNDLYGLAINAGFAPEKAQLMAAISMGESSGNPNAINPKDPGGSYGLTQINAAAHGADVARSALNPENAFKIAYRLSKGGQDFSPWSVYKSGAYKQYLGQPQPNAQRTDLAAGTGDFSVPSHGEPPPAAPDTVQTAQRQGPAPTPASFQQPMPEAQYRQQQPGGFGAQGAFSDSGAGAPQQAQRGAPQQAQQQADPMAAVQQQVQQGIQKTAQTIPPPLFGRVGLQALMKQIDQANPGADEATKFMMLEGAQQLLAPDAKMQWEMYREQHRETFEREMATFRHNLSLDKAGSWIVQTEPETGEQYRYNATTAQSTTLTGQPYTPKGAQRLGGAGASQLSADRAKDLATETKRLDTEWAAANPLATEPEKQQAHFQNRAKAEQVLANAKASTNRISPSNLAIRKEFEENPDWTPQEMQTYINNTALNSKITASFANGDAAKQMRAVNTVADHILRVQDYAEALRNNQIPRANQLANATAKELGRPEVTTFEAGRDIMADEVVRLLTSTGGTEKDREGMQSRISAMMSPEQFAGVFGAFRDFSGARFEALRQQYSHNDPRREAEFSQFLTPAARKVFEGMKPPGALRQEGGAPTPAAGPAAPAPAPDGRRAYKPGEVVEKGGKRYRVTGGDPYNPDVEEVK